MNLLVGSGGLTRELIAGDVDYFKALIVILLIHFFDRFVVWCKAAAGCGVYDEHDFALVIRKLYFRSIRCRYTVIIDSCHNEFLLFHPISLHSYAVLFFVFLSGM